MSIKRWLESALFCLTHNSLNEVGAKFLITMAQVENSSSAQPARIPVLITNAERMRRVWRKRVFAWILPVVMVCLVGIYLVPLGYKKAKSWRAHQLVGLAANQKSTGERTESRDTLLRAYLLDGSDDIVLRAMAENYAETPMEKLQFLQRLSLNKNATPQDRLNLCRVAVENRLTSFVTADFERLMADPQSRKDPEASELCARFLTLQGQWAAALEWTDGKSPVDSRESSKAVPDGSTTVEKKPAQPSEHPRLNIIRAKLLLDAPQPDKTALRRTAEEVKLLLKAAIDNGRDNEQREAALLLARVYVTLPAIRDVVSLDQIRSVLQLMEKWYSEPKWEARLVAADVQIFLDEASRDNVFDALSALASKVDDATQQELARWFARRNEAARAQLLAENDSKRLANRDWFLIRIDALATQRKWAEIEKILLIPQGVPIEEPIGRLFLWRCAKEQGVEDKLLDQRFQQVLSSSKDAAPGLLFYIAGYLEQVGERTAASNFYRQLTQNEAAAGPAYVGLVRCLGADPRQTAALRDALEKMLARYPNVKEARNDLAYLNLLDQKNLVESIRTAGDLALEAPNLLAYRTTMALAELVRGNPKNAESIYSGVNLDWTTVNPGWVAVRAAVLGANGKKDEARMLSDPINPAMLREGEKRLLDRYVNSATVGTADRKGASKD